jgi:hypothetical protein
LVELTTRLTNFAFDLAGDSFGAHVDRKGPKGEM